SIASANGWLQSAGLIFIQAPQLNGLSPPLFQYCLCISRYLNAPSASSKIHNANVSCWPQQQLPSAFTDRLKHYLRSNEVTREDAFAGVCGRRSKQCFRRVLERFSSMPTRRPPA